jgi:peroxiredoxin
VLLVATAHDPLVLPADLPVPVDDGAAYHLAGARIPPIGLRATDGSVVTLADVSRRVVFCYPRTGRPGVEPLGGAEAWDAIPGARGCTPQACSYRDHHAEIVDAGYAVYGLSTQESDYQQEAVERLQLPYALLSDSDLRLATALRLPTFRHAGHVFLKRLTLIAHDGVIVRVQYPVFPPDRDAERVVAWLTDASGRAR